MRNRGALSSRILSLALAVSLLGSAPLLSGCESESNQWHNTTVFDPSVIEGAIVVYYGVYAGRDSRFGVLSETDRTAMVLGVAEKIAILGPAQFNSILAQLAGDYRNNPERRPAIEALLDAVYPNVAAELQENREFSLISTLLDDVFIVAGAAYVLGFGRGVWASRGSSLRGVTKFRRVMRNVAIRLPRRRVDKMRIIGLGTAAAIMQTAYHHLSTHKVDPRRLLTHMQNDGSDRSVVDAILFELGEAMALRRDQLRDRTVGDLMREPLFCLDTQEQGIYRDTHHPSAEIDPAYCLGQVRMEIDSVKRQLEHFFDRYPETRPRMEPLAMDVRDASASLEELQSELGVLGLSGEGDDGATSWDDFGGGDPAPIPSVEDFDDSTGGAGF
ncbi:MAG: hypothetical protein IT285_15180 [Bdellovibrionales bacterium]|nr:hypothetical protein [Bdellovibrionales bacterium]